MDRIDYLYITKLCCKLYNWVTTSWTYSRYIFFGRKMLYYYIFSWISGKIFAQYPAKSVSGATSIFCYIFLTIFFLIRLKRNSNIPTFLYNFLIGRLISSYVFFTKHIESSNIKKIYGKLKFDH